MLVVAALAVAAARSSHAQAPADLQKFLREVIKLTDPDLADVDTGKIVTRLLPKTDEGEIAAFGVVRVDATAGAFEKLARDPRQFNSMEGREQIGVFSDPPVIEDVAALKIPGDDIEALEKCKPGSCDVKLTDDGLKRIAAIDWSAKDAKERATYSFKDMMIAEATSYHTGGIDALGTIVDKKEPKSRADEFRRVLQNSRYLFKYIPGFHQYIENYPKQSLENTATMLYWTRDSFSPKPVISVCAHNVTRIDNYVITGCQLLAATHFFNAGLDVCVAVPAEGKGLYLVDVYRVRIDPPTGMLAGPAMKKVEGGITEGVGKSLAAIRSKLKS
jgi:hypothetical protein